jgi:hypothetical protein
MGPTVNNVLVFASLDEIEDFLRKDVGMAQMQRETADSIFWRVYAEVSDPDHDRNLASALRVQDAARKSLLRALERLNAFLVSGTIPDEFLLRSPLPVKLS